MLRNFQAMLNHGRLAGTGYVSILPVDQGIEHSAGASFARIRSTSTPRTSSSSPSKAAATPSPRRSACSGSVPQVRPQDSVPVKLNHNEFLTYPNKYDQIMFASVKQAFDMGAVAVGATIYFGSDESDRQIRKSADAFAAGPRAGHGHRPLVLPAQTPPSRPPRRTTTSRPT